MYNISHKSNMIDNLLWMI